MAVMNRPTRHHDRPPHPRPIAAVVAFRADR
jgi:hypothetical protein